MSVKTILEVAMEISYDRALLEKIAQTHKQDIVRACAMSNSVGGIGPLLKERIAAQAKMGINVIGVSLMYDNVWTQGFHPWGQMYIQKKHVGNVLRQKLDDTGITLNLNLPDQTTCEVKVWKTSLENAPIYLLDNSEIASVVYPGPEDAPQGTPDSYKWVEKQKLLQGWLVGRGALALMKHLNIAPNIIIQSETPTFFANHFLIQDEFKTDPFFANTKYIFNDHTPLEYAHPIWPSAQLQAARVDKKYSDDQFFWNKDKTGVDVTRLLIGISDATYGVSEKHGRVMRAMPSLDGLQEKIGHITNGVRVEDWQHSDYINAPSLDDNALLALKEARKKDLREWFWKRYKLWYNWKKKAEGKCFVLWTRRVTSYKRFDILERMLTDHLMRQRFLNTNLMIIVGGRIHQNDDLSQNIMFALLDRVTRDPELSDRVIVIDNYNIWDAPRLFQGVDATIMLADDGREAAATGFMKAQVNGGIVIGCSDGAVPESVNFFGAGQDAQANGFEVPYVDGQPQPEGLLHAFEQLNAAYNNPAQRAQMIRASIAAASQVSIHRCAQEMQDLYNKLIS